MASNTDVVKKTILYYVCIMSLSLCLYVCLFAIIKSRSSNFPELLMMMPVARSTASQVAQYLRSFANNSVTETRVLYRISDKEE